MGIWSEDRDPKRIKRICQLLGEAWSRCPDQFESSLTEDALNGLTELGLAERRTEGENSKKN